MITVTGARTHNLRDIDVEIPSQALTVVTGLSGPGKSSLVFDTIAAEAQRATAAGYPSFVRTRLAQYPPADVDRIDGLTFTTVVDQRRFTGKPVRRSPRPLISRRRCGCSSPGSLCRRRDSLRRTRRMIRQVCA